MSIIIGAFKMATAQENYVIPDVIGIGGVTTVTNDLFKISIEEAIVFLESFKDSVDEKLKILQDIDKCKTDKHLTVQQDEIKANLAFEALRQQLQSWLFGKGGVSLNKN